MCDVLVEHDPVQHPTLLNLTLQHLFNSCISLDINGLHAPIILCHNAHGFQSELAHEVGPTHDEFSANGSLNESKHFIIICGVDWDGYTFYNLKHFFKGFIVGRNDDHEVDVTF
jgi:hypothetical protein